jgi:sulfatase maturation enzyme AslB (radical SAM superfamily)
MGLNPHATSDLEYGVQPLPFTNRGYYIYITEACNLRCSYCFVSDKTNNRHLTPEMANKVLTFIKSDDNNLKETDTYFFGGEPLIRLSIVDYLASQLRALSQERGIKLKLGITTNGTLLATRNHEILKGHNIGPLILLNLSPRKKALSI